MENKILIIDDDAITKNGVFNLLEIDYKNYKRPEHIEFPFATIGTTGNSFTFYYCEDPEKFKMRADTFMQNNMSFSQIYFDMKFDNYGDGSQSDIMQTKGYELLKYINLLYTRYESTNSKPKLFIYSILQPEEDVKRSIKEEIGNYDILFIQDKSVEGLFESVDKHSGNMLRKIMK